MKRFGAVCALLYITGKSPHPLSPAVILFIVYGFDFRCLTPAFIGEWFSDLHRTLSDWIAAGSQGDISSFASHFISYHESEVIFSPFII